MKGSEQPRDKKFSIHAYDQLINSSRNGSVNSSQISDGIKSFNEDTDKQDRNGKKSPYNQSQQNFTLKLQQQKKLSSQAQILNAFNSIRDMSNKEQINKALLQITQVKDRILLVEKLLERREQITKAKEMQAINNLAPLFNKIKAKFLSSLEKNVDKQKERKHKTQGTILIAQKDQMEGTSTPQTSSQHQIDSNGNIMRSQNRVGSRKKTGANTIIPHSPTSRNLEQPKDEEGNTLLQQNKNIMGAITIFATHDIKMDKDKEEQEKKIKQNKLLGYLQKDNLLKVCGTDDRLKSPSKNSKRKSNMNQSNTSSLNANTLTSGGNSNQSPNLSQSKKKESISNSQQVISPTSGIVPKVDYNQQMQALKKRMYQVGGGVGRRDSSSSNHNKHFRVRSLNGSPSSSLQKQLSNDPIKMDESQKYFFKPQLNNFSSATQSIHNHSNSYTNFNNFSLTNQQKLYHKRSSTNKHQSNDGILYDFIIECEQKRLLQKNPQLNNDMFAIQQRSNIQSQNGIRPPFKTSLAPPNRNLESRQNVGSSSGSVLQKIFFMKKQYSNSSLKTPYQMHLSNSKFPKNTDIILDHTKLDDVLHN